MGNKYVLVGSNLESLGKFCEKTVYLPGRYGQNLEIYRTAEVDMAGLGSQS